MQATNVLSWQLATTGSSTFTEETFPPLDNHPLRETWIIKSSDGNEVIARLPGAVIAAIPAYWVLGSEEFSAVPGGMTAAVLTAISVSLFALTLRDRLARRDVAISSLIFGLSTPVWSVAADGMWPHTITVFGICGMSWAASRERWWLVGLFGGVAIWGRLHVAIIVALVGLWVGLKRRDVSVVWRVGIGSSALLALTSVWSKSLYGSWSLTASYGIAVGDNPFNTEGSGLANQLGFLVSLDRGLLVWTPIIVLLAPALSRNWRSLPDWSRSLVWGGIAYTVVQGMRNPFGGADSFYGYRLTLELLACPSPALAMSSPLMGRYARLAFGPVLAFQTLVISVGAVSGNLGSLAEDAWATHTLLSGLAQVPLFLFGFLVACVCIGLLGQRILSDPALEK
ncbi:MAG: hypothetical protein LH624_16455 [Cryobacterium sp.]|nr:hypothetical protein [Cryobacterium sp.]